MLGDRVKPRRVSSVAAPHRKRVRNVPDVDFIGADALRGGLLRVVLETFESAPLPVSLVRREQAPVPLKLRAFLDFVMPRLRARLSG